MEYLLVLAMQMCKDVVYSELKCSEMYIECVERLSSDKHYSNDPNESCAKTMIEVMYKKRKQRMCD